MAAPGWYERLRAAGDFVGSVVGPWLPNIDALNRSTAAVGPDQRQVSYQVGKPGDPMTWLNSDGVLGTHWPASGYMGDALAIPGVWRAVTLLSGLVASLPVGVYRAVQPLPKLPTVLIQPTPWEPRANTFSACMRDLLLNGNAILVIHERDADDFATSVVPIPTRDVGVALRNGSLVYRIGEGANARDFPAHDVVHLKGYHEPGDLTGQGVLQHHLGHLARIDAENTYAASTFASAAMPSGILKVHEPEVSKERAKVVKDKWREQFAGRREPAVLSDLMDFTPLSWSPTDAQLAEARQMSLVEIAQMFGLPGYWLDAPPTSMVYESAATAATNLVRFTLEYWLTVFEAGLSKLVPRGQDVRFNRDQLLREPLKARYEAYEIGLRAGFIVVDEVRADESLRPLSDLVPTHPAIPDTANPEVIDPLNNVPPDQITNQDASTGAE